MKLETLTFLLKKYLIEVRVPKSTLEKGFDNSLQRLHMVMFGKRLP